MTGASQIVVDTAGWDIAVSLPLDLANEALAASSARLLPTFSYKGSAAGQPYSISGAFGPWAIVGGSDQDLLLELPIASGSFVASAGGAGLLTQSPQNLAGITVPISTRLAFAEPAAGGPTTLVFAFTQPANPSPSASVGAPASSGTLRGGAALDPMVAALLPEAIAACLADNMAALDFVFAALAPAGLLGQGGGAIQCAYVMNHPASGPAGLVILSAAGSAPPGRAVPAAFAATTGQCAIAVSQARTLDSVIKPAMIGGIQGAQWMLQSSPVLPLGPGPQLPRSAGQVHVVQPATFDASPTGITTATISATGPVDINLEGIAGSIDVLLTNLVLSVNGGGATLSCGLTPPQMTDALYTFTASYQAQIGVIRDGAALTLAPAGAPDVQPTPFSLAKLVDEVEHRTCGTAAAGYLPRRITASFQNMPISLAVTLLNGQSILPSGGYMSGGVVFWGNLQGPA